MDCHVVEELERWHHGATEGAAERRRLRSAPQLLGNRLDQLARTVGPQERHRRQQRDRLQRRHLAVLAEALGKARLELLVRGGQRREGGAGRREDSQLGGHLLVLASADLIPNFERLPIRRQPAADLDDGRLLLFLVSLRVEARGGGGGGAAAAVVPLTRRVAQLEPLAKLLLRLAFGPKERAQGSALERLQCEVERAEGAQAQALVGGEQLL